MIARTDPVLLREMVKSAAARAATDGADVWSRAWARVYCEDVGALLDRVEVLTSALRDIVEADPCGPCRRDAIDAARAAICLPEPSEGER